MFSLESPHRGDSNEYTQYTIFNILKKITLNYPKSASMGFSQGLKNEFETAVVNEPSVFEPLKFYGISRYSEAPFFPTCPHCGSCVGLKCRLILLCKVHVKFIFGFSRVIKHIQNTCSSRSKNRVNQCFSTNGHCINSLFLVQDIL